MYPWTIRKGYSTGDLRLPKSIEQNIDLIICNWSTKLSKDIVSHMHKQLLQNFSVEERWLAKKVAVFKYTLLWSKLYSFADPKCFVIITYITYNKSWGTWNNRHRFYGHNSFSTVVLIDKRKVLKKSSNSNWNYKLYFSKMKKHRINQEQINKQCSYYFEK